MSSRESNSENLSLSFAGEEPVEVSIESVDRSPCAVGCPAGVNVKAYVTLIAAGRFKDALEIVRDTSGNEVLDCAGRPSGELFLHVTLTFDLDVNLNRGQTRLAKSWPSTHLRHLTDLRVQKSAQVD